MAQTIVPGRSQEIVISSLDTYNHTALNNSLYTVSVAINEIPPSGISIVIKQNSTTIATSTAPAASQGVINLQALLNCSINDVIGVVITSSSAAEALPNSFKGFINIRLGTA